MNNLIATMVAVVAMLLLIVVAAVLGEQLFSGGDAQKAVSEIHALNQAARSLLVGQESWGNQDLTAALANSGLAPANMITSPGALTDPWGGAVSVGTLPAGTCAGSGPAQCVSIGFSNVPESDCARMATSLPVDCAQGGLSVNGNVECGAGLTPAWAAGTCTAGNNLVSVQYGQD